MNTLRAYFSKAYWAYGFSLVKAASALLSAFGVLWLCTEVVTFFSPNTAAEIRPLWWLFLILGAVSALWINRPIFEASCTLHGRDIQIRVRVGDFFSLPGAKVIGSNTTFDTSIGDLIDEGSIQGQFTRRNYTSVAHLDSDLSAALAGTPSSAVLIPKPGKSAEYPIGTIAKLRAKEGTAYLVALARMNQKGVAAGSFDDLKTALPALWEFITTAGTIEPLVIPVLGSGFSRIPEKREAIVREVVDSFIAACAVRKFTGSLTIAIRPADFYEHAVNLSELEAYIRHVCKYTEYGVGLRSGAGTAV